jgi:hypothetical protein
MRALTVFIMAMMLEAVVCAEPRLASVYPIGGARGSVIELKLKGLDLDEASVVWFGPGTEIFGMEKQDDGKTSPGALQISRTSANLEAKIDSVTSGTTVNLRLTIDPAAREGHHSIALLTPAGLSNSVSFRVNPEPVVQETDSEHNTPQTAQQVSLPVVMNGRIETEGELDYYALKAEAGREYLFEVAPAFGLDPVLSLHDPEGSWFDPERPVVLISNDDPGRFAWRFEKAGRYLVSVKPFLGVYKPDFAYQLRIVPTDAPQKPGSTLVSPKIVKDGRFGRDVGPERMKRLMTRSLTAAAIAPVSVTADVTTTPAGTQQEMKVATPDSVTTGPIAIVQETEPNNAPDQAITFNYPGIVEGTIGQPGDVDHFKFSLAGPAQAAFEIQAPDAQPNRFTPWIAVYDASGEEVAGNLFKRIGGDGDDWLIVSEPRTLFNFKQGGEFAVHVRDITSRVGGEDYKYRLLVRPQIPHVGDVQVKINPENVDTGASPPPVPSTLNISPGQARTLTVTTSYEEGYAGDIAISVENLPAGIQVLPATRMEPEKPEDFEMINKEWYVAKSQQTSVMLLASADAQLTRVPQYMRVHVRPVLQGRPGSSLHVKDLPVMVVDEANTANQ